MIGPHGTLSALSALLCVVLGASPATASPEWGDPQPIGGPFGSQLSLSSDGQTIAWVTGDADFGTTLGAVYTSSYQRMKKRWTRPAAVPQAVLIRSAQLSADGSTVMMDAPGTGVQLSQREGAQTWPGVRTIVSGKSVVNTQMSSDAKTLVWQEKIGPRSADLLVSSRQADGTWGAAFHLGASQGYEDVHAQMQMSVDGATLAWIDADADLVAAVRDVDAWDLSLIQELPFTKYVSDVHLSDDGSRMIWIDPDATVLETHRGVDGWSPPVSLATAATRADLSPDGTSVAYVSNQRAFLLRPEGAGWRSKRLGPATGPGLAVSNTTVLWSTGYPASAHVLHTYDLDGTFARIRVRSWRAIQLTLSKDGTTIAWADPKTEKVHSVRR